MAREQGFAVAGHRPAAVGRARRARHRPRHRARPARDLPARGVEAAVDRRAPRARRSPIASSGASAASRSPQPRRRDRPGRTERRRRRTDPLDAARAIAARRRRRRRPGADRRRLGPRSAARARRQGPRPRGLRPRRRCASRTLLAGFGIGQHRRRELHGLQGGRPRRLAAPPRIEDRARPQGLRGRSAIPALDPKEAARRRDFTINAISLGSADATSYLDPFDGRDDLARPRAARRRSADVRRRQPARAARAPVRRPLRGTARAGDARDLPRHPARRSAGRAHLGRGREAAAAGASARRSACSSRSTSASSSGCGRSCTRWSAASRIPSGTPKATSGCTR